MNKDTVKGSIEETGGAIRKKVGQITGDKEGEARGAVDEIKGNAQKNYGKVKDAVKDAVNG